MSRSLSHLPHPQSCSGLKGSPSPKDMSTFLLPEPVDVTLFGKRVTVDITKLRILTSLGDLPHPGIGLGSPALQVDSLPSEPPGKPILSEEKDKYRMISLICRIKKIIQMNLFTKQTHTLREQTMVIRGEEGREIGNRLGVWD